MKAKWLAAMAGIISASLVACAPDMAQRTQQDQVQTDIDASRTLRGDTLAPGYAAPHRRPGEM